MLHLDCSFRKTHPFVTLFGRNRFVFFRLMRLNFPNASDVVLVFSYSIYYPQEHKVTHKAD